MRKKDFTVIIAGRENVGKSSVFNKILSTHKSIVDDFPGVTRDRIYAEAEWLGRKFTLVDTGGLLLNEKDLIKKKVAESVKGIIKEADLVVFMVDAKVGIIPEDRKIFDIVKQNAADYVVAVNKMDNRLKNDEMYEFYNLGVDTLFPMSAAHSIGIDDLLDFIVSKIPKTDDDDDDDGISKIAIIGKENVGKSSLFNAIVDEERSMVTEIPGTTRDSIDSVVEFEGKKFLLIDTAGVKKRKRITQNAEKFSIGRSFANIKKADLVMLIIDAVEGIQDMDKKVLGYAFENYRAMVLVVNKWDLVPKERKESVKKGYIEYLKNHMKFARFAPITFVSAKEKRGLKGLFDIVFYVEKQYNFRVQTSVLNKMISETIYKKAPSSKTGSLKILYASQVGIKPPSFVIFVNKKEPLKISYLRYLQNRLREYFGFDGVPLKINIKTRVKKEK